MRRKDREVTDFAAMVEIVKACGVCRLGMQDGEGVYMVPLNFGFAVEEGQLVLYFHGADAGKKLALLRQNPAASFEMDTGHKLVPGEKADDYTYAYRSVLGRGSVEFLEGRDARLAGLNRIMEHYSGRGDWTVEGAMLDRTAVYRLRVSSWTAKEHKVP